MGRIGRWMWLLGLIALVPQGCGHNGDRSGAAGTPVIRVLLLENQQQVNLAATEPPSFRVGSASPQVLNFPKGAAIPVSLTSSGWQAGAASFPYGELSLEPAVDGTVSIAKQAYRGRFRFVPTSSSRFDVVNDVNIDGYLKGVVSKELYPTWHE